MAVEKVPDPSLERAIALHRSGSLAEAVPVYLDILRAEPEHAQALNLLGVAFLQLNDLPQAIAFLQRAVAAKPGDAEAQNSLGLALHRAGRHADAVKRLKQALKLWPDLAIAYVNLGNALRALRRPQQALTQFKRAAALQANLADAHIALGETLQGLGRRDEAVEPFRKAVALNPNHGPAQMALGNLLQSLGRPAEALLHNEKALALQPQSAAAHMNLANALRMLGETVKAVQLYQQALALNPNFALAHCNLGSALAALHRYDEAFAHYERALALQPVYFDAQLNYGNALQAIGRYSEAIERLEQALIAKFDLSLAGLSLAAALQAVNRYDEALSRYDQTIASHPKYADAHSDKALCCLRLGRFREGWSLYDYRWIDSVKRPSRGYRQRRWNGKTLDGTLLVWGEQGLGDQILYASMFSELLPRVASIVIEVEPRLVPLFARSFPKIKVVSLGPKLYPGTIHAHIPFASLGTFFRTRWEDFPRRQSGYLVADESRARALRASMGGDGEFVVGLSWISKNPKYYMSKSAQLRDFESLMRIHGLRFVDLQYGNTTSEREALARDRGLRIEHIDEIDNTNDIDGLAALITACDAVVTVSNTTAHLAGALGKPVWVLVPHGRAHLWYWFKEGYDSPWYPRVRVKRQKIGQSWTQLIASVVDEIASGVVR